MASSQDSSETLGDDSTGSTELYAPWVWRVVLIVVARVSNSACKPQLRVLTDMNRRDGESRAVMITRWTRSDADVKIGRVPARAFRLWHGVETVNTRA